MYTDGARASEVARPFLVAQPVRRNVLLTSLGQRVEHAEPGRYWLASEADETVGLAMQSPLESNALLAADSPAVVDALAGAMYGENPELPGISGEAAAVSRFAGIWTELSSRGAFPSEGGRLYQLNRLTEPSSVVGVARRAGLDESELLAIWHRDFCDDTGNEPAADALAYVRRRIDDERVWVWDDDGPVSMAMATHPIAGASRIAHVYTPPAQRGRGYGAAITAGVTSGVLQGGTNRCLLYTQLANSTSNKIYRRIGYEAVEERLTYHFDK